MSPLGVYIHVPYCLQRCHYCDFATFVHTELPDSKKYIELVKKEIAARHHLFQPRPLSTLYFGGGTPSLLQPSEVLALIHELGKWGFNITSATEVTLEINPATLDVEKINSLRKMGVNRFSVGAQTFNDFLLKKLGRIHSTKDTLNTLDLLKDLGTSYSLDLLFALPGQSLQMLDRDLDVIEGYSPNHVSPYCLTLPGPHPLNQNRPKDDIQIKMFQLIEKRLINFGLQRYEISNFAKSGKESKHNTLYWTDEEYWGIGLSAHSYSHTNPYGWRFWNPVTYAAYEQTVAGPPKDFEVLELHQSLTDFCHTSLRTTKGLVFAKLANKFPPETINNVKHIAQKNKAFLDMNHDGFALNEKGRMISNQIFETFTFLK